MGHGPSWREEEYEDLVIGINRYGYGAQSCEDIARDKDLCFQKINRTAQQIVFKLYKLKRKGCMILEDGKWKVDIDVMNKPKESPKDSKDNKEQGLKVSVEQLVSKPTIFNRPKSCIFDKDSQETKENNAHAQVNKNEQPFSATIPSPSIKSPPPSISPSSSLINKEHWTRLEIENLIDGVNKYGVGNWTAIFGDSDLKWKESKRKKKTDQLRRKFLKMRSASEIVRRDGKWYIDANFKFPTNDADFELASPTKGTFSKLGKNNSHLTSSAFSFSFSNNGSSPAVGSPLNLNNNKKNKKKNDQLSPIGSSHTFAINNDLSSTNSPNINNSINSNNSPYKEWTAIPRSASKEDALKVKESTLRRRSYSPWTDEEILSLVDGLNKHKSDLAAVSTDMNLIIRPRRRYLHLLRAKCGTLTRLGALTQIEGRWQCNLELYREYQTRHKAASQY